VAQVKLEAFRPRRGRAQAILFDLDGTLLDSLSFLRRAFQNFLNDAGVTTPVDPKDYDGLSIHGIAAAVLQHSGRRQEAAAITDGYIGVIQHAYEETLQPVSGAGDVLTCLRNQGLRLGLVTSAVDKMVGPLLARIGWGGMFDVVVCGDRVGRSKPAPDCYVVALKSLGLTPEDAIAIEDSANGVLAARGAGLTVIGISSGNHAAALRAAGAAETIAALTQIPGIVFAGGSARD
jgi:sugar-phosphatase